VFDGGRLAGIVAPADISRALERISGNRGASGSAGRRWRPLLKPDGLPTAVAVLMWQYRSEETA
jgi:hypothetical protein